MIRQGGAPEWLQYCKPHQGVQNGALELLSRGSPECLSLQELG